MSITIIISNDMWNEKNHMASVSSFDQVEAYVHFDQPISHELEYIEKDVTNFWMNLSINGEFTSLLKANKVLLELMDEAKMFKNGKFKFSISKLPDAITQHFHSAFPQKMASLPEGKYTIDATFHTDNPPQEGKTLAEVKFDFLLEAGSYDHLLKIVEENNANGADKFDDASAKMEKFANINKPSEKFAEVMVTLSNKGNSEIIVMAGFNSGNKFIVPYQQKITISVPAGTEIYKVDGNICSTNFGNVSGRKKEEQLEVY